MKFLLVNVLIVCCSLTFQHKNKSDGKYSNRLDHSG